MQRNYRHTKDVLRHSAVYKKRRKLQIVKTVFFGVLLLIILIGVVLILRMSTFTISEIQVKGLQSANTQDVIDEVESKLGGNYALILPRKNIFFYPKSTIRMDLLSKFRTFGDIQIKTIDTNKLEITVVEKNAVAISCRESVAITAKTYADCFFIDQNARPFQAVLGEPDQSLGRYVDLNVNTASSTLSADIMNQVQKVKADLAGKNLTTSFVKIVDSKTAEFQIVDNGKIIISLPVTDDFISILDTALNTKALSSGAVAFEYIDARFGNKVFFKLGSGAVGATSTNASSTSATSSVSIGTTSTLVVVKKKSSNTLNSTTTTSKKPIVKKKH